LIKPVGLQPSLVQNQIFLKFLDCDVAKFTKDSVLVFRDEAAAHNFDLGFA